MLIIFDKDKTTHGGPAKRPPTTLAEQRLLPGVAERCAALRAAGHRLALASNQGGVAFGYMSVAEAEQLMEAAAREIGAVTWRMCPHHPRGRNRYAIACGCRKPQPGMLWAIMKELDAAPEETLFVGDRETDRQAARAAGVKFAWATDFFADPSSPLP